MVQGWIGVVWTGLFDKVAWVQMVGETDRFGQGWCTSFLDLNNIYIILSDNLDIS